MFNSIKIISYRFYSLLINKIYNFCNKKNIIKSEYHIESHNRDSNIFRSSYPHVRWNYAPYQSAADMYIHGSRNLFCTDCGINGEYFKSKSSNEYYQVIQKNMTIEDMCYLEGFFHKEHFIRELKNCNFANHTHIIIKLIFDNDKSYFVEANQNISISNPNFEVIQNIKDINNFINNLQPFVPIPE